MEQLSISQDDVEDVKEMTSKLENFILESLDGVDEMLAISSLINASINCMLAQCKTFERALIYRNLFISILDMAIVNIQINPSKDPS